MNIEKIDILKETLKKEVTVELMKTDWHNRFGDVDRGDRYFELLLFYLLEPKSKYSSPMISNNLVIFQHTETDRFECQKKTEFMIWWRIKIGCKTRLTRDVSYESVMDDVKLP